MADLNVYYQCKKYCVYSALNVSTVVTTRAQNINKNGIKFNADVDVNFSSKNAIPDVWRYVIKIDSKGNASIMPNLNTPETCTQIECKHKRINSDYNSDVEIIHCLHSKCNKCNNCQLPIIVLLLESPHEKEYDTAFYSKAPAQGKSKGAAGGAIENYIEKVISIIIDKYLSKFGNSPLIFGQKYRLVITNPVPHQCSLYHLYHTKLDDKHKLAKVLRNQIWLNLWNLTIFKNNFGFKPLKKKFKNKITDYEPKLIINACTKGNIDKYDTTNLQKIVTNFLTINTFYPIVECYHPAMNWVTGSTNKGKKRKDFAIDPIR